MPALGMAQDSGVLVRWLKSPGDPVAEGDGLFEVETDKTTMEVEAQASGYLGRVTAADGDDIPVGQVIALITEQPDPAGAETPAPPPALPTGTDVIMPALGMAQDSGLIVAWHKSPGDPVQAGDILFEVETDKATMEVEAGQDGYLAALLVAAGATAPVGETIAIISVEKPTETTLVAPSVATPPVPRAVPVAAAPTKDRPKPATPPAVAGRILASPKARRLALEQGLDLGRLVTAGHPQPYHVDDIEVLRDLRAPETSPHADNRRVTAKVNATAFTEFSSWAAEAKGLSEAAILAGFAAAGLRAATGQPDMTVAFQTHATRGCYLVPVTRSLAAITEADGTTPPDCILRDLRQSALTSVRLGAEEAPVLTLLGGGGKLRITIESTARQLSGPALLTFLTEFANRIRDPLRHLL